MSRRGALVLLIAAFLLALGLALGGYFIGHGFAEGRRAERYVTVKGLAERAVTADLATWPLRFTATSDDLSAAEAKIAADLGALRAFLAEAGFAPEEIEVLRLEVTDLLAQPYRPEGSEDNRYILAETLVVRSGDVARVAEASRSIGRLIGQGVVLADTGGPRYAFTHLNAIKPALLAEATANARQAAAQFATDSGAHLQGIRRANQGVIQILGRDEIEGGSAGGAVPEPNQIEKKIRVVATLDYLLTD
jgi:hypothetical protein